MKTGIELIAEERNRQILSKGWSPDHDKEHINGELVKAAVCYATPQSLREPATEAIDMYDERELDYPVLWPFEAKYWKPSPNDRVKELVKAGALIVAEIDRLQTL